MKHHLSVLFLVVTLTACKKEAPNPAENTPPPPKGASVESASAVAPDAPPPPAPTAAPVEAAPATTNPNVTDSLPTAPDDTSLKPGATDQKLTLALQYYVEANSKMPQNFQQLVTAKYIEKVPTPPPGKKFAIDRRHLQVVVIDK